jgi:hypothetical protein
MLIKLTNGISCLNIVSDSISQAEKNNAFQFIIQEELGVHVYYLEYFHSLFK